MVIFSLGNKHKDEITQISDSVFCNGESYVAFAHQKYLKFVSFCFIENTNQHLQ